MTYRTRHLNNYYPQLRSLNSELKIRNEAKFFSGLKSLVSQALLQNKPKCALFNKKSKVASHNCAKQTHFFSLALCAAMWQEKQNKGKSQIAPKKIRNEAKRQAMPVVPAPEPGSSFTKRSQIFLNRCNL